MPQGSWGGVCSVPHLTTAGQLLSIVPPLTFRTGFSALLSSGTGWCLCGGTASCSPGRCQSPGAGRLSLKAGWCVCCLVFSSALFVVAYKQPTQGISSWTLPAPLPEPPVFGADGCLRFSSFCAVLSTPVDFPVWWMTTCHCCTSPLAPVSLSFSLLPLRFFQAELCLLSVNNIL